LQVSVVGLGAFSFGGPDVDQQDAAEMVGCALDAGVNLFDTANVYQDGRS
jgi:1-deoxyxylulose-5-phosphate synthase